MTEKKYHPVVQELIDMIAEYGWQKNFEDALKSANSLNVVEFEDINTLDDYFKCISDMLTWIPMERPDGLNVHFHIERFYFLLQQPSVFQLQSSIVPHDVPPPLTPLSAWMTRWADEYGKFLDTPESLTPESEKSFYDLPVYNMHEYIRPHGGWGTFNKFFARRTKPGYRPVAAIADQTVIVSAADSTIEGQWEIRSDSQVCVKGIVWKIEELLEGSPYKDRFKGGMWMHAFLSTNDYHRQHAPVGGKVLEARTIMGAVYAKVITEPLPGQKDKNQLTIKRTIVATDEAGYQFMQARGLVVIESEIGLVAVMPIGMSLVSSVILTAEEGVTLQKGEEISYFQFGGSDIVLIFEQASNVDITAMAGQHYKVGRVIGKAYPAGK